MKKIFNSIVIFCVFGCLVSLNAQTYDVVWTDLVGVTANGNTITKIGSTSAWDSGAASANLLGAGIDGWVETTINGITSWVMFGLASDNNVAHHNSIDYAIYLRDDDVFIYHGGSYQGSFGSFVVGDILRVERIGNTIEYKKNGSIFHSTTASTAELIVDASIYGIGMILNNVVASFDDPANGGGSSTDGGFFVNDDNSTDTDIRYSDGKVVIGNSSLLKPGDYQLYVEGGVLTEKVKVAIESTVSWADYVFEKNHNLITLQEVEKSIIENKHLPNVPSAEQMVETGLDVAKMDATLLRQIEELWLHTIELKKENEALKKRLEALENKK